MMEANSTIRDQLRAALIRDIAPRFAGTSLEVQRATLDAMGAQAEMPANVVVARSSLAGVPVELLTPMQRERRVVLHLHGGGFAMGSAASHRALAARIGEACRARVVLPEYRLAPEHPFPAGLDDALAVYKALLVTGTPAEQIIVTGDSAGGNLATAMLLRAKAVGLPMPRALVLLSPFLDLTMSGESMTSRAQVDPWLAPAMFEPIVGCYLGASDRTNPFVSPLFGDLRGLPPMLLQVGDHEVLLSDTTRMAERAHAAGVDVELEVYAECWHVFQLMAPVLPDAMQAFASMREFVDARFSSERLRKVG